MRAGLLGRFAAAVVIGSLLFAASASANTITVDSTADTTGGPSICTLRDAINTANKTPSGPFVTYGNCATPDITGADTIDFNLGAGAHTIQLGSQLPPVVHTATITGPGAALLKVQGEVDAAISPEAYPIFETDSDASFGGAPSSLTLEDMTIAKGSRGVFENSGAAITLNAVTVSGNISAATAVGSSGARGAGVESAFGGPVTINDSTITGNSATATTTGAGVIPDVFTQASGAAIDMTQGGTLTITDSTVSGNHTTANGNQTASANGVIYESGEQSVTVTRSTVSGNTTTAAVSEAGGAGSSRAAGGGIYLAGGNNHLTLDRATVSGNSATATAAQSGDGSATGGGVVMVWFFATPPTGSAVGSTIAGNAVSGAGSGSVLGSNIDTSIGDPSTFNSKNTIIAAGTGAANCFQEGDGDYTSSGYNIDSGTSCLGTPTTGDQVNTLTGLGPLQDNGGVQDNGDPVLTRAPALNSPAVDKGTNTGIGATTDQRGTNFDRTFDMSPTNASDGTDIGAFEQQLRQNPGTITFAGSTQWGTTGFSDEFTLTNLTGNSITPNALAFSGTNPGDFELSNDTCSNTLVTNKAGCTVDVAFHPVSSGNGARTATLPLATNLTPALSIAVDGTTSEYFTVAPAPHDFGSTLIDTPTGATQFTVTNSGPGTSGAMAATLTGANASEFGITQDNCTGLTLSASGSCTVFVRFAPASAGAKAATLAVAQAGGTPQTSALTGTATTPVTPPPNTNTGPTGQRAAALKKCKKKKSAKARKKCKQKAKKLPV